MSGTLVATPLDPTPRRPEHALDPPVARLTVDVEIDVAHLANPAVAVTRLLTSEANAFVHVDGDDDRLVVSVALPGDDEGTRCRAEEWVRWAIHNAGIRGRVNARTSRGAT